MSASKKLYIEVAEAIRDDCRPAFSNDEARRITGKLAIVFKRDNPRFKASTFFEAAGYPELTNTQHGLG
jgi:hypothetical protein